MNVLSRRRSIIFAVIVCSLSLLQACANQQHTNNSATNRKENIVYSEEPTGTSVVAYDEYNDALEPFNRAIFAFNDVTFRYALGPLARGYQFITPDPVERGIGNVFGNIGEPLDSLNSLMQGKFKQSGQSLLRFLINSTIGLAGIFDVADSAWDIKEQPNTFGDTFAYYGAGYGTYLVVPLLGPSDLRSGTSSVLEIFVHPINQIDHKDTRRAVQLLNYFQDNANTLAQYSNVVEDLDDPYIFTRNLYLQGILRDQTIIRGEDPATTSDAEPEAED